MNDYVVAYSHDTDTFELWGPMTREQALDLIEEFVEGAAGSGENVMFDIQRAIPSPSEDEDDRTERKRPMTDNNWYVVATTEDGYVSLYGPYSCRRADQVAEDIFLADSSGNTETEVIKPTPLWENENGD